MAQESTSAVVEAQSNLTVSNGRSFQELNNAYKLPTDSGEHSRLDLQHEALSLMLGGSSYQSPELVKTILSSRENVKRRVLDVGAGSGKWAIGMAEEFPHADVLGIDLVLPNIIADSSRHVPPNCSFRIADANKDMENIDFTYDLIHLRCVEAGILDSDLFFFEAARVLRPGGVLLLVGSNVQLVDGKGQIIPLQKPGDVGYSHFQHFISCAMQVHLKAGPLRIRHALWKSMLNNNPNYSKVHIEEILAPTGPWPNHMSDAERKLAETMQQNILRLLPAFKALLLRDKGFSEEFVDNLVEGAIKEIRELSPAVHGYSKWVFATAVRAEGSWVARKDPWQEPDGYNIYDYIVSPLPQE